MGIRTSTPLVFSAILFGIVFGFIGASGGLPWYFVSSMSYIIFAGSAQFIALILIIDEQPFTGIIIAAVVINLRHLLYSAVLSEKLKRGKRRKMLSAYFLTDESFLVTTLVSKEAELNNDEEIIPDDVLLASGLFMWISWNMATIVGFTLYQIFEGLISLPDNFIIAASFVGFLLGQWVNFPKDRIIVIFVAILAVILGFLISTTWLLIVLMAAGSIFAMVLRYLEER
ncbi:MAG: AzlC family ABC transporter permease [Candidatus Kariarchaeaceae archaeon]|jgi:4-azaleucine resistance transporter AzlC